MGRCAAWEELAGAHAAGESLEVGREDKEKSNKGCIRNSNLYCVSSAPSVASDVQHLKPGKHLSGHHV